MRPTAQTGFTLVEVLVALAIVTIAFAAIMGLLAQAVDTTTLLSQRNYALWVAQDRLAQLHSSQAWPSVGSQQGKATLAQREWHWQQQTEATADASLRRVIVTVRTEDGDNDLIRLVAALRQPPAKK